MESSRNKLSVDLGQLDLSEIRYPSDALSIGVLRQKVPLLFDKGFTERQPSFFLRPQHAGHAEDVLGGLLCCERLVALSAYGETIGMPFPFKVGFNFAEELANLYVKIGLAGGQHEASELIRGVEQQAAGLANRMHAQSVAVSPPAR